MGQIITATFENGMLKPDTPLDLPSGSKVRLVVEPVDPDQAAWEELEKLWETASVDSGGKLMTRDELHERR
jgi:predicted DNA-binding antitoxin AbrB/MazE fold protein